MKRNIIVFSSVLFFSTTLCAQINHVQQFKPTFFQVDNSRMLESHRRAIEADNNRNKDCQNLLASVRNKVLNYLQGETDEIFFAELKAAMKELGEFGSYIDAFSADKIQKISNSVDESYVEYLQRKKYPQTTTSPTDAEQVSVDSTSTVDISSEIKSEQEIVKSDSMLNNNL